MTVSFHKCHMYNAGTGTWSLLTNVLSIIYLEVHIIMG